MYAEPIEPLPNEIHEPITRQGFYKSLSTKYLIELFLKCYYDFVKFCFLFSLEVYYKYLYICINKLSK